MLDKLKRALDDYQRTYRHPNLPRLECSDLYALFTEETVPIAKMRWDDKWPNSERAGVYLIFSKTGKLLYVGKAWVIGRRLANYFQYDLSQGQTKKCRVVHDWKEPPMYVATVAVPEISIFEAAALEEFLIRNLEPCENKMGLLETARLVTTQIS
jgi:hypothetical protein